MIIKEISKEIHDVNVSKGFWPEKPWDRNFGEALALVHAELSEALESHRENSMDSHLPNRSGVEVELADACIRIFDMAYGYGYDLEGAIREKVDYNKLRPHKHGKKY